VHIVRAQKIFRETQHDIGDCGRHRREGQRPLVLLRSVPFKMLIEFVGDHPAYGGLSQQSKRTYADVMVQQFAITHRFCVLATKKPRPRGKLETMPVISKNPDTLKALD
jgi:hypothetical protein